MQFFFDTADVESIRSYWHILSKHMSGKSVAGITTNPNALAKINCYDLERMRFIVFCLCRAVSHIRNDDKGVVYVQMPYSQMPKEQILAFVKEVMEFTDGKTSIALKIPPFKNTLDLVEELNEHLDVNVTGIAECATALKCLSYNVRYISMIPGRMEEKGIDAKEHVQFVNQRNETCTEIIAGSMRTLEGLRWVIENNMVPTIGTKVFDKIIESSETIKDFSNMWNTVEENKNKNYPPLVTREAIDLSRQFFGQMDNCGAKIYQDFLKRYVK